MSFKSWPVVASRAWRNLWLDLRFRSFLVGRLARGDKTRSPFRFANSDYGALAKIFGDDIQPEDVLVDVGCGHGRVLNWWLEKYPNNRIFGLEMNPDAAQAAAKRLTAYENVTILPGNACDNIPVEGSVFYLFNPFGIDTLRQFMAHLKARIKPGDNVRIFYYNCKHVALFQQDPWWQVELKDIGGHSLAPYSRLAIIRPQRKSATSA